MPLTVLEEDPHNILFSLSLLPCCSLTWLCQLRSPPPPPPRMAVSHAAHGMLLSGFSGILCLLQWEVLSVPPGFGKPRGVVFTTPLISPSLPFNVSVCACCNFDWYSLLPSPLLYPPPTFPLSPLPPQLYLRETTGSAEEKQSSACNRDCSFYYFGVKARQSGTVIGAIAMMGFYINIDREDYTVTFWESTCTC